MSERIKAGGCIISDACVARAGEEGALEEGLEHVRAAYRQARAFWAGKGARIHINVVVERPDRGGDTTTCKHGKEGWTGGPCDECRDGGGV